MAVSCEPGNTYDGKLGARISSIFVIFFTSLLAAWLPVYAAGRKDGKKMRLVFFLAKYFGSGVIIGTALIHLLAPANQFLLHPCLTGVITKYSWAEGICLMSIFVLFFIELVTMRSANISHSATPPFAHHAHDNRVSSEVERQGEDGRPSDARVDSQQSPQQDIELGNVEKSEVATHGIADSFPAQLVSVSILEFGVIFHSIFIGLTLAVTGEHFAVLYAVLTFHQTFEGLALGSRFASIKWPKNRHWTPYLFGIGFAASTPLAIGIGLAVRTIYQPGTQTALIINGVFDSISAGILIYTALVELMAHDFIFSAHMQQAPLKEMLGALFLMCLGAGVMAMLGFWA